MKPPLSGSWKSLLSTTILFMAPLFPAVSADAQIRGGRPGLLVLIVIDQMRADYLTRFVGEFESGGFMRLLNNGAFFGNAHVSYGSTATAPGHATIVTGRLPRHHGVVANEWLPDRGEAQLRAFVYDPEVKPVVTAAGAAKEGRSPRWLIGTTLGDQIKLADRRSRVFSVSLKDRAAILMGGKRPDGVFWWDLNVGHYVTSTYYGIEAPNYVREFNNQNWANRFLTGKWDRLLPTGAYELTHPLDPEWVGPADGLGPVFPHLMPPTTGVPARVGYEAIFASPFGNDVVLEMARRIMAAERLGTGPALDMLAVGLSSFDAAGHLFGPESPEMMDFVLRTDRQLAGFLGLLDRSVGLDRCLVVLTADHGITTPTRLAQHLGLGGGRIDPERMLKGLNTAMARVTALPGNKKEYVSAVQMPWIFLDNAVLELGPEPYRDVLATAADYLRGVQGIADVFTALELSGPQPQPVELHKYLAWRSYHPRRAGELYVHLSPYWHLLGADLAEHGTAYNHDRHVPIVIMGPGIRAGRYFAPADQIDISPTVAAALGIEAPVDAIGRVLNEALDLAAPR